MAAARPSENIPELERWLLEQAGTVLQTRQRSILLKDVETWLKAHI